ncbi:hypothetical protein V2J09_013987 [Rumex salicifolius]
MKSYSPLIALTLVILISHFSNSHAQCRPSGTLIGTQAPEDECDPSGSDCCEAGQSYTTYQCSPQVSGTTSATLTLMEGKEADEGIFEDGGDGGAPSACDGMYHSNNNPVVALSTGWYEGGSRCGKEVVINGNGMSVRATVVDMCDSTMGCDKDHGYQPPCRNNIVDGSMAVWEALGVPMSQGEMQVTWSDA